MLFVLAAICGLVEAIFTALEVALGAVSRARLRAIASPGRDDEDEEISPATSERAALVLQLLERPDRLSLLFITVTSLSLWTAATALTWANLRGDFPLWALMLGFLLLLFVAEVLPLLIAARHAETIALRCAPVISLFRTFLSPLLLVVGTVSYFVARLMGSGPNPSPHVTEGELRTALATAEEEGAIESEERALIEGAMDLRETTVREVMTPRPDVIGIPGAATLLEALDIALRAGHSRLPVYDGSLDKIVGVLATKDLLPHLKNGLAAEHLCARDVVRAPYYVPEGKRVAGVLDELRRGSTLMAIVVDDNGGTAGLVTLEDLLEEIVGEIQDEYDAEEASVRLVAEGDVQAVLCEGSAPVRDFGRFFAREFKMRTTLYGKDGAPVESSRSLASLALELFEDVPKAGDHIAVGKAAASTPDIRLEVGLDLVIERMDGPRIAEVRIVPTEPKEEVEAKVKA